MVNLDDLQKIEDGLILESAALNRNLSCRLLKNQSIHPFVRKGHLVTWNTDKWVVSGNAIPSGMYAGNNIVVLQGLVTGLSNLIPGVIYYMRVTGELTPEFGNAFNGVKAGYALGETSFLLDIDVVGTEE